MYAYVFDSFVQEQKYRSETLRIESRLSTLGIQGRSEKITILKNLQDSVRGLLKRGAETLVVVGNDLSVAKALPFVIESEAALGFIPMGQPNTIARALGIPSGASACEALSKRIMRRIDVGVVAGAYFLLRAELPARGRIQCDGEFSVTAETDQMSATIYNLSEYSRPDDGKLELVMATMSRGVFSRHIDRPSVFSIGKAKIERHGDERILLDGQLTVNPPATISVLRQKLHVVVGRTREFD